MMPLCTSELILHSILFINAESIIEYGGLMLVCLIVFCTTGLFFTFFLPGGAVLFSTGVLVATGDLPHHIVTVLIALIFSSVAGSWTGYLFGRYIGPGLYKRKDSFYYKKKHLAAAELFYEKYGGLALMAGYFLPVIRTFSTILAGITGMNPIRFLTGAAAGSILYITSFTGAGYFLGSRPELKPILGYIVAIFLCVVTIPVLYKIYRSFGSKNTD